MRQLVNSGFLWTLAAALVVPTSTAAADEGTVDQGQQKYTVVVQQADDSDTGEVTVDVQAVVPGKYWVGIVCSPLENDLVKAQLGIESGLVIEHVVGDSPAAKAGLEEQDIVVEAGGRKLDQLDILVDVIKKAESSPLKLTVYHKGKKKTVTVKPAKRPDATKLPFFKGDEQARAEWKMLQEALRKHGGVVQDEPGDKVETEEKGKSSFFYVMPGFVLSGEAKSFPENLEVSVTKKGDQPAKITVKRGKEEWQVDENSLDKLPAEIRPHVQRMVNGGISVEVGGKGTLWPRLARPMRVPVPNLEMWRKRFKVAPGSSLDWQQFSPEMSKELREKIEKQLEEAHRSLEHVQSGLPAETLDKIQQELKQLRRQIEQLRNKQVGSEKKEQRDKD